jgi:trigger factor
MQTSLETLDQLTRRLNVAVPIAQIEGEVQKRLARLAKTVKIAGFRPGKVPLKMVAQQYGPQVRSDVIADAVNTSFSDAVREQNLRVAGYPRIERRQDAAPSQDALEFSAVFEVYPDVTIPDVADIAIERPVTEVTAADVDRTLDVLRAQRTQFVPVAREANRRPHHRRISPAPSTTWRSRAVRRKISRDQLGRRPDAARIRNGVGRHHRG